MAKRLPEKKCAKCKHYHCRANGKKTGYIGDWCPRRDHPCIMCKEEDTCRRTH